MVAEDVTQPHGPPEITAGPCSMCGDPAKHRCYVEAGDVVYTGVVCSREHALDWCLGVASTINVAISR